MNRLVRAIGPVWWVVCTVIALIVLFPIVTVALASFKTTAEIRDYPPSLLPHRWTLGNYRALGDSGFDIWHAVANSADVTIGTVVVTLVAAVLAGYVLARFDLPGERWLLLAILSTMMMPFQALLTPLFVILQAIGLNNSLAGLTLVYATSTLPFAVFVIRNSMRGIPAELTDAAVMDGAGRLRALTTVILPLAWPGVVSAALFVFFTAWNEFLGALILLSDQGKYTLPVILTLLQTGHNGVVNWGILDAGVVTSMVPCLILYLLLQRYYVSGLLSGAVR